LHYKERIIIHGEVYISWNTTQNKFTSDFKESDVQSCYVIYGNDWNWWPAWERKIRFSIIVNKSSFTCSTISIIAEKRLILFLAWEVGIKRLQFRAEGKTGER
jgi:hypothetical protein